MVRYLGEASVRAVLVNDANRRHLLRNVQATGVIHPDRGTIGGSRADRDYRMSIYIQT
jgi:hypothetical protein